MTVQMKTGVLVLGYRRFEETLQVLESAIESGVGPVFLVIDGPQEEDIQSVQQKLASNALNLFGDSLSIFQLERNQGTRAALKFGLEKVFATCDSVIVLEDDCLPSRSFFSYCQYALIHYKSDSSVGCISGRQAFSSNCGSPFMYKSRISETWGWATWRDRLSSNSFEIPQQWSIYKHVLWCGVGLLPTLFFHRGLRMSRISKNIWDFQFAAYLVVSRYYTIRPSENLVQNVGFGQSATHTYSGTQIEKLPSSKRDSNFGQIQLSIRQMVIMTYAEILLRLDIYHRMLLGLKRAIRNAK